MAENQEKFVVIRIKEATRARLKVKAARERRKIYEVVDSLSK